MLAPRSAFAIRLGTSPLLYAISQFTWNKRSNSSKAVSKLLEFSRQIYRSKTILTSAKVMLKYQKMKHCKL